MEVSGKKARNQHNTAVAGEVSGRQAGSHSAEKIAPYAQPPVCRVCERTGEINDANTLCVECNDYMCGNCARAHRGSRTSRRHQLLDKSQMPRKAFNARHMCGIHPDILIEYYCKKQDQLLCRHCITLHHQGCQRDDLITNVCDHVDNSKEFRNMYKGLNDIEQKVKQLESQRKDNLAAIDNNQYEARRVIDNYKKELYLFVDRLVDNMHKDVDNRVDTDKNAMAVVSEECDNVAAEVSDLIAEMDIKKQSKEKIQIFIVMKTAQQATSMLGHKMEALNAQNRTKKYTFEPDKLLRDVMGSVQKLGQLSQEREADVQTALAGHVVKQRPMSQHGRTMANKIDELALRGKSEKSDCCISGIELVDEDRLAMVDYNNDSVKMLSIGQKRVIHKLQLHYQLWDITKVSKDTLAVTCPKKEYIQLVSVSRSGSLSLGRHIRVQGQCRGIQYSAAAEGRMIVSFIRPAKVQIINMSGKVLKDLSSDSAGKPLFARPEYVAFSSDGQCIYISDAGNASVTGITLDGTVVFIYRDDQLEHPTGLAVRKDGAIFVGGGWSHNIHLVSSKGKKIKIIFGEENREIVPQGILYKSTDQTLYAEVANSNSVLVFTLTQ